MYFHPELQTTPPPFLIYLRRTIAGHAALAARMLSS